MKAYSTLSYSINSLPFSEPKGTLCCSQHCTTGPNPEPDEYSPRSQTPFPYDQFQYDTPIYA